MKVILMLLNLFVLIAEPKVIWERVDTPEDLATAPTLRLDFLGNWASAVKSKLEGWWDKLKEYYEITSAYRDPDYREYMQKRHDERLYHMERLQELREEERK